MKMRRFARKGMAAWVVGAAALSMALPAAANAAAFQFYYGTLTSLQAQNSTNGWTNARTSHGVARPASTYYRQGIFYEVTYSPDFSFSSPASGTSIMGINNLFRPPTVVQCQNRTTSTHTGVSCWWNN
jgi:hypothetical protein